MTRGVRFALPGCLLLALLAVLPLCSCRGRPNVMLIVVDTLRADRLGAYGGKRGLTPFLNELARRGTVFANAYAASSWTPPSVASLLTSRYPSQHGVNINSAKLANDEVTLAECLAAGKYASAGFSANPVLSVLLGFGQGFDPWSTFEPDAGQVKVRGERIRQESLAWVDRTHGRFSAPPRLLYLQYMEPHYPYVPPEPFRARFLSVRDGADPETSVATFERRRRTLSAAQVDTLASLYDGEVAAVDAELRRLLADLEARGFLTNAVVIVTADHGEEFREHQGMVHGNTLYDEVLRVPLLFVGTGIAAGRVVEQNVSLVDVAPTVLDLAGVAAVSRHEGRSLARLLDPATPPTQEGRRGDVIGELMPTGGKIDMRFHSRAIIHDSGKLLLSLRNHGRQEMPEAYDLLSDPGEHDPNSAATQAWTAALLAELARRGESMARAPVSKAETVDLDEATRDRLRALGYAGDH